MLLDAHKARKAGRKALVERQRARLAEMVSFARANSNFYRQLYQDLPEDIRDPSLLPVTSKKQLMAHFNEWVCDSAVTIENVRTFTEDPHLIGERFLGKYTVVTTSGTTGTPGMFLVDDRSMTVVGALGLLTLSKWLSGSEVMQILLRGWRMANVVAVNGHFSAAVASGQHKKMLRAFPVDMALPELVSAINDFRPTIFGGYASTIMLLAGEQEAGRLNIAPVLVLPIAEGLTDREYDRIGEVFNTKVRTSYAASECPFLSYSCAHKWLHVDSDWVVLEAVDADYKPISPGEQSHTVLLSNLANRIQPILRYDLGDSIQERPEPCPCGDPLPAIRVKGRTADLLIFPKEGGGQVSIPALALEVDHVPGIDLFQIVQAAPNKLRVRLKAAASADPEQLWKAVRSAVTGVLRKNGVSHIEVERAVEEPEQSAGGKYRTVIPLG